MKALIVGDVHLSDKPPSVRTESYAEDVLDKLRYTVTLARDQDVDIVVWAGDVFHIKTPSRTSHALVMATIEVAKGYHCPLAIVPGNHDLSHDRLDSLSSQPLGVLFRAGAAVPLIRNPFDLPVFGIPYLQDWKTLPTWMDEWRASKAFDGLLVTHAPLMPPGVTQPYEIIDAEDWAALQEGGYCYYGHIHDLHGVYEVGGVTFCNQGALSRGSLHESTLAREPAVTLWTSERGFERIEVPHKPIEEVFRLAEHEEGEARVERLDEFLGRISGTTLDILSVESVLAHVATLGLKPKTEQAVRDCLEEVVSR